MTKSFRLKVGLVFLLSVIGALVLPVALHAETAIIYSQQAGGLNFVPVLNPSTGDSSVIQSFNFDKPEYLQKGVLKSIALKLQIVDQAYIDANEGFILRVTRAGDFNQCSSVNAPSGSDYVVGESFIFVFEFDPSCTHNWFDFGLGHKLYSWGVGGGRTGGYRLAYDTQSNNFWQVIKVDGDDRVLPSEEPQPSGPMIYNQKIFSDFVPVLNPISGDSASMQLFNHTSPEYLPEGVLDSIILNFRIDSQITINDDVGFILSVTRVGDFESCKSTNAVHGQGRTVGEEFRFQFLFDSQCTNSFFNFGRGDRLYSWGFGGGHTDGYKLAYDNQSNNFWQVISAQGDSSSPGDNGRTPVLIVPGIMGTEMRKDAEIVWPDINKTLLSPGDGFMDSLAYTDDGEPSDVGIRPGDVVGKFGPAGPGLDYTDSLVSALQQKGYELNKDLFLLPYDWRRDIADLAATDMRSNIDAILLRSGKPKVDVIAHSQGGLVIKRLLYGHPEYEFKIETLIFVGTPNLGAPQVAKTLLYGDSMGLSFLRFGLNPLETKKIARNMPSVYQLLPSQKYFDFVPGYVGDIATGLDGAEHAEFWDYADTERALSDAGLNGSLVRGAEQFHDLLFDGLDFSGKGIRAINISGCETPTVATLGKRPGGALRLLYGAGDGTVPVLSATYTPGATMYYGVDSNLEHSAMLSNSGIQKLLVNIVSQNTDPFTAPIATDSSSCHFSGQQVEVRGAAVELSIVGGEGSQSSAVPGIALDKIGGQEFAFISDGAGGSVSIVGVATGKVDIYRSRVIDGNIVSSESYHNVSVNENENVNFDQLTPLILDAEQSADVFAPHTEVEFTAGVNISFSANDVSAPGQKASGVLETTYKLDDQAQNVVPASGEITVTDPGVHTLVFSSVDVMGNKEQDRMVRFEVSPASVVSQVSGGETPVVLPEVPASGLRNQNTILLSPSVSFEDPQSVSYNTQPSVAKVLESGKVKGVASTLGLLLAPKLAGRMEAKKYSIFVPVKYKKIQTFCVAWRIKLLLLLILFLLIGFGVYFSNRKRR